MKHLLRALLAVMLCAHAYAAQQTIGVGSTPNDGTGDTLRAAMQKTNSNFTDLYNRTANMPTLASGSTVDLGSIEASAVKITGNATITSFGSSVPAGGSRHLFFTGTPTITYNATSMILPAADNLTVSANTWLTVISLGSGNWTVDAFSLYQLPNDVAPGLGLSLGDFLAMVSQYLSTIAAGPCASAPLASSTYTISVNCTLGEQGYLSKSGSNLAFCPHKGNNIMIAGTIYAIPNSCVTLPATGLTPSTYYYIYAYSNSGALTLEASTTGHATNSSYGYEQKSGDASRALVGAAYVIAGPAFADGPAQRYVASWFNPQPKRCINTFSTNRTQTGSTAGYSEVNSEIECNFIILGPPAASGAAARPVFWHINGASNNGTGGDGCATSIAFDSTTNPEVEISAMVTTAVSGTTPGGMAVSLTETGGTSGLHYATLVGKEITGGTCTWYSAYSSLEVEVWQ